MNRLQTKCLVASAGIHLLLLVIIIVGPAFILSRTQKPNDLPLLNVIPPTIIDALFSHGGSPNARTPAPVTDPPPPPPTPEVKPSPPELKPEAKPPPEPKPKPEPKPRETPPPPEPRPDPKPKVKPEEPAPVPEKPPKKLPEVSTTLVRRTPAPGDTSKKEAEAAERQARERERQQAERVTAAVRALKGGLSGSTSIEMPGPGGGGPAYANYEQVVKSVYFHAWIAPAESEISDEDATVRVAVTIARDGTVLSGRITRASGQGAVDASVRRTLERVKFVAPFPEGAREERRDFILLFNLKTKLRSG